MIKRVLIIIGTLVVIFFVDKTGRRPMFFVAGSLTMAALLAMGGLGLIQNPSVGVKQAIVGLTMVFPATYFPSFGSWYVQKISVIPCSGLLSLYRPMTHLEI
jgi:hypothetical protein